MGRWSWVGVLALAAALLGGARPAAAQTTVQKRVTWNLDALVGHPAGGFELSFQLTDGSGLGNGSTTVQLAGGGLSPVTLTDTGFFQFANQSLSPVWGTPLEFDLTITYAGADAPTPDQFSFAVLDSSGFEVPTLGPADAAATVDVTGTGLNIATYAGDPGREPLGGGPTIALAAPVISDVSTEAVPEPGALLLFLPALGALVVARKRGNRC